MSKSVRNTKPAKRSPLVVIGIAIVAVIGAVAAILLMNPAPANPAIAAIGPAEYVSEFGEGTPHYLLDVRTSQEYAGGHIAGSANISVETLADNLSQVPRDRTVVVYCRSGNRSAQAARILADAGFTDIRDLGGINTWVAQGYAIE